MSELLDNPRIGFLRTHALTIAGGVLALGVAAALVLPGSGGDRSDSGGMPDRYLEQSGGAAVGPTVGGTGSARGGKSADSSAGLMASPDLGYGAVGGSAAVEGQDDSRVVKTGSVSLVVDDGLVSATVARVQDVVRAARGFVADSQSEESGENPSATITVRVPVESFDEVIAKVRGLGAKVVSAQSSGRDVTATYADTKAQIQSLQAARARYLVILGGAKTIADTLTVQQRIDDVQGQIDRLEGQRRVLADQSDLATLTVSIAEKAGQFLLAEPRSGWSKAWHDATDGFTGGLQSMLAHSGRVLLLLLVAAALFPLTRFGVSRVRRRSANAAE
jgi:hypothetical protein